MTVTTLLAATTNSYKLKELQTVAREYALEVISPTEHQREHGLGPIPSVEEIGRTYRDNALLKAEAFARWAGCAALGDDSGLEVTALGNRPGVNSRRYAGPEAKDNERIAKLLGELSRLEEEEDEVSREAFFCCSLALVFPDGRRFFSEASLRGEVLYEPRGSKGFGYDPIILIDSLGKTLAEVDFEVTCSRGFRAQAAQKLFSELRQKGI